MMSQNDTSDDETDLQTPRLFLNPPISHSGRNNSVIRSPISPTSSVSSSVIFGQIPDEVLRAWSQLPEAIRLDPSLAVFQREYDRIRETRSPDYMKRDCLVVNMSLGTRPVIPTSTHNQSNADEDGQDVQTQEKQKPLCRYIKLIALSCCWLLFTVRNHRTNVNWQISRRFTLQVILMFKNEKTEMMHQLSVSSGESKSILLVDRENSNCEFSFILSEMRFKRNKIS
ncbi:uncharacterized protein LOC120357074 isoform X1 [Solenopsis invicta]|uniref:uncharacterized protein LOC120357074 isoform X1 n=1 Tax=Solenopsis invicta TaxID=13686 RepID=UPI00193D3C2B|nr:uncharacterized protein LOC120357074 isoform X1 [Solenopsis invicta]